jgi:hypothetical protein
MAHAERYQPSVNGQETMVVAGPVAFRQAAARAMP